MTEANFVVVFKTKRKSKGGKRDGRHGHTGKVGIIYRCSNGKRGEELHRVNGPNFKEVSRELRRLGNIPTSVTLSSREDTYF